MRENEKSDTQLAAREMTIASFTGALIGAFPTARIEWRNEDPEDSYGDLICLVRHEGKEVESPIKVLEIMMHIVADDTKSIQAEVSSRSNALHLPFVSFDRV